MKYVYKFTTWILFSIIVWVFGFAYGIKWLKERQDQEEQTERPEIKKTEAPKSDRYKRASVGFCCDEWKG